VWSRNLVNEEAMARVGAQTKKKKKKLCFSTNRLKTKKKKKIAKTEISSLRQIRNEMTHLTGSQAVF